MKASLHRRAGGLRLQYTLLAALLAVIPVAIVTLFLTAHLSTVLSQHAGHEAAEVLNSLKRSIRGSLAARESDVLTIASYPPIRGLQRTEDNGGIDPKDGSTTADWRDRLQQLFSDYMTLHPGTLRVRFLDADGMESLRVDSTPLGPRVLAPHELEDKSSRQYFLHAKTAAPGEVLVSDIDLKASTASLDMDVPTVRLSTPVWNGAKLFGVIVLNFDPTTILEEVHSTDPFGELFLATSEGVYMHHSDPHKQWSAQRNHDPRLFLDWPALGEDANLVRSGSERGIPHRIAGKDNQQALLTTSIELGGDRYWILGIATDPASLMLDTDHVLADATVVSIITALLAILVAAFVSARWARPISNLAHLADEIRDGDFSVRAPAKRRDEIGALEQSFNGMAAQLESTDMLAKAKQKAEEANTAKTAFLAAMSHELRTPLTAILGYADLVYRAIRNDPALREDVDTIRVNGHHLLSLINNILDLSKIEAGRLELERVESSPSVVVGEVMSIMAVAAREKGLELIVDWGDKIPATVVTDPTRLRQILLNLVGNAIKFTEAGTVRIEIRRVIAQGAILLEFAVHDSGVGIPDDKLEAIFGAYQQADASITRQYGGSGLGLAISRQLAEALGGRLLATSTSGKGSTFTLTITTGASFETPVLDTSAPVFTSSVEADDVVAQERPPLHGRVLLAEDTPVNRRLICNILQNMGLEAYAVEDGQQALDAALGERFDLVLMDMQMPVMDGLESTRAMRAEGVATPIICLTANAMRTDRAACLAAGANAFITKPIVASELYRQLANHLQSEEKELADANGAAGNVLNATAAVDVALQDVDGAIKRLGIDRTTYAEAVAELLPWLDGQASGVVQDLAERNHKRVLERAHAIKSASGNMGLLRLQAVAGGLELAARDETDGEIEGGVTALLEVLAQTAELLAAATGDAARGV